MVFRVLFQIPVSKSTVKRWIDEIGDQLPGEEEILKQLTELKAPTQCHIDAYYPLGTHRCMMVIKDEFDRILITHETETENADDAKTFLTKLKKLDLKITSAFSDYSKSFIGAIKEVFPEVRFQADYFHTVKNVWKQLKRVLKRHE